jgi:hypothetical protein
LGEVQEVPGGGFSFRPPAGYQIEIEGGNAGIFDQSRTIIIALNGSTTYNGLQSQEDIIDEFLSELEEGGVASFERGEPYSIVIDGVEGTAIDLSGTLLDFLIKGQATLVLPAPNQFLFGLAIANLSADESKWDAEGAVLYSTVLESVQFMERPEISGSACPVSADDSYGYSEDNPIKVGGDWLDGPSRERAYLNSLSGPNGEIISYEREGSLPHGETILDLYTVTYADTSVTLYIDMYVYEDLMAPLGFICWTPIPLSEPE